MKKHLVLFLALALVLFLCAAGALAAPEDMQGQTLADFSAETIGGPTFTLSESLKTHDLVLINFWATWCGPCCMEFPYLEAAWEQHADRVDVIALSVEETDTFDVLRNFAGDYGLNFHIGRDDGGMFYSMEGTGIPTTLIVDRDMRVVEVEVGSQPSAEAFTSMFDRLLASASAREQARTHAASRCILHFVDTNSVPVPGVTVAFCNGEYTPVETDTSGCVYFDGDPKEYHVHLLAVPEGYEIPWEQLSITGNSFDLTVTLYPV